MDERIRVLHLIKSLGRGGAEMLLPEGLRAADRERFDYRYAYFLPWKDAMVTALECQGASVSCLEVRRNVEIPLRARRVAGLLREWRADVLHCHLPLAGIAGRIAGRMAGVPVVYSEHNLQERYHTVTRQLNSATWAWQAMAVAVSGDVAGSIHTHIGTDVPVRVVLNGVDVRAFRRDLAGAVAVRRRFGIPDGAPIVGTVAVFRTQKRLDHWLQAASKIRGTHPDARFLIVGDGPLRDEVLAARKALGLEEVVHLPGLEEDVRPYLSAMDVYMISSAFEGLPVAMLEAMAMECAVVATAVGGIPEAVRNGEQGNVVPPGDPHSLAAAASALLGRTDRGRAWGARGRRTVEDHFSMNRMQRDLEGIYLNVIDDYASN